MSILVSSTGLRWQVRLERRSATLCRDILAVHHAVGPAVLGPD